MNYSWPGNVRNWKTLELTINLEYVPIDFFNHEIDENNEKIPAESWLNEDLSMESMEKYHITNVLKIYKGNITKAAEALGIGRNTLYRKIQKYKINSIEMEQSLIMEQ